MDKKKILKKIETGYFSLQDADEKIKSDKEIVFIAVKQDGGALKFADKKLKEDKDIIKASK